MLQRNFSRYVDCRDGLSLQSGPRLFNIYEWLADLTTKTPVPTDYQHYRRCFNHRLHPCRWTRLIHFCCYSTPLAEPHHGHFRLTSFVYRRPEPRRVATTSRASKRFDHLDTNVEDDSGPDYLPAHSHLRASLRRSQVLSHFYRI